MVKRWVMRKDGIRQRYNVTNLKLFRQDRYYDRKTRSWRKKPPAAEEKKPIKAPAKPTKEVWRMTLTIDVRMTKSGIPVRGAPIQNEYYSYRLQRWAESREELTAYMDDDWKDLTKYAEHDPDEGIGYDEKDWWFVWSKGEEIRPVQDAAYLVGQRDIKREPV